MKTMRFLVGSPSLLLLSLALLLFWPVSLLNAQTENGGTTVQVGYAILRPDPGGNSVSPAATVVFSIIQNEILVTEAAVPAARPTIAARMFADISPPKRNTGIAIANPNSLPAHVAVYLSTSDGQRTVASANLPPIPPGGQVAKFIDEMLSNLAVPFQGVFNITSDVPVALVSLRLAVNERGEVLLTTLPVADLKAPVSSEPVWLPQVGDGGGISTQFILVNPTSRSTAGRIAFFGQDGKPLAVRIGNSTTDTISYNVPPDGVFVTKTGGLETLKVGSAVIQPEASQPAPVATAVFSLSVKSVVVTESGVGTSPLTRRARVFVDVTSTKNTGVAIANPSRSAPLSLNATLRRLDGTAISAAVVQIPPSGQAARFASELFPSATTPFQGVLELTSDGTPFVPITLRQTLNQRGEALFTTLPVANLDVPPSTEQVIMPHLASGGGVQTEIILLNSGSITQRGNIDLLQQDGKPLRLAFTEGISGRQISLSAREAPPAFTLRIDGTNLAPPTNNLFRYSISPGGGAQLAPAQVFVRFFDEKGFSAEIPLANSSPTFVATTVPPFINLATGEFDSGTVNVQLLLKAATDIRGSNVIEGFRINALPSLPGEPGTLTVEFLSRMAEALQRAISNLDRIAARTPSDSAAALRSSLNGLLIATNSLSAEIKETLRDRNRVAPIGEFRGRTVQLDASTLAATDRLIAALLLKVASAETSGLSAKERSSSRMPFDLAEDLRRGLDRLFGEIKQGLGRNAEAVAQVGGATMVLGGVVGLAGFPATGTGLAVAGGLVLYVGLTAHASHIIILDAALDAIQEGREVPESDSRPYNDFFERGRQFVNGILSSVTGTFGNLLKGAEQTRNLSRPLFIKRPEIRVFPQSITFPSVPGRPDPPSQLLDIFGIEPPHTWAARALVFDTNVDWLGVSPTTGLLTPARVSVFATDVARLTAGQFRGKVEIHAVVPGDLFPFPRISVDKKDVEVSLRITGDIAINPSWLTFSAVRGGGNPQSQTLNIASTGGALTWGAATTTSWLKIEPSSGKTPSSMTVSVDIAPLAAGTHSGKITLVASPASNSPLTVTVTLTVTEPVPVQQIFFGRFLGTGRTGLGCQGTTSQCNFDVRIDGITRPDSGATVTLVLQGDTVNPGSTIRLKGVFSDKPVSSTAGNCLCFGEPGELFDVTFPITGKVSNLSFTGKLVGRFTLSTEGLKVSGGTITGTIKAIHNVQSGATGAIVTIPVNLTRQ